MQRSVSIQAALQEPSHLPQLLDLQIYPIRIHDFLILLLALLLRATTVVKVSNVGAIKQLFLQRFVDLVVNVARPCRSGGARRDLRGKLVENLTEMAGTFAALERRSVKALGSVKLVFQDVMLTTDKGAQIDGCRRRAPFVRPGKACREIWPWSYGITSTQLSLVRPSPFHSQSCP